AWRRLEALLTSNGQSLDAHGRRISAVTKLKVAGRRQRAKNVEQVAGDGDLADGIAALAVFDPETGRAAAVVAGHGIDAHADQFGDVKALADVGQQLGCA